MAWNRKTLTQLISETESEFSSKFFGFAGALRRGTLKVLARVWSGLRFGADGYVEWAYDNTFVRTADGDQLDRLGAEIFVFRKAASFADGFVQFSGDDGTLIPEQTPLQSSDGEQTYQTLEQVVIQDGIAVVEVVAVEAGSDSNASAGSSLFLVTSTAGIQDQVLVIGDGLSGGADLESDDQFRERILFAKRNPSRAGDEANYIIWATSVQPVTDAFIIEQFPQANSVTVVCANYNQEPPTLTQSEVDDVEAYLLSPEIKPLTSDVQVFSCIPRTIDITAKITPNNAQTKSAAVQELKDLFIREGVPQQTIFRSSISAAISGATGINGVELLEVKQDGVVVQDVVLDVYGVAVLGTTTFTDL